MADTSPKGPREGPRVRAGDMLGRFRIEQLVERGGMGAIYRARDTENGEVIALKMLRRPEGGDFEQLMREAWVLSSLQHPGIVRYINSGQSDLGPFLAMEWLEGEKLSRRLARGPLGVVEAVDLTIRVADALAIAHRRGLVHRDIKPGNLFLVGGALASVKLLDFGLAHLSGSLHSLSDDSSDRIVGTPSYMAPEQARGEGARIDPRADVFSLGCVLFECLAGRAAFSGKHVTAVLAKVLFEEAAPLNQFRGDLPPGLQELLSKMLSKDPTGRPKDGAEVAARLRGLSGGVEAAPVVSAPLLTRDEQRLLSVILAAGALSDEEEPELLPRLREVARRFGGRVEPLADGSLVVLLSGLGAATDQARQAARCALELRELLPYAVMALATGRGEAGPWPVGEVIERGVQLVRQERKKGSLGEVRLDPTTEGLLGDRFLTREGALYGEQDAWEAPRTLLGKPTPFVGREVELDTVSHMAWRRLFIKPNATQACVVSAAPGIGKSRFAWELSQRLRDEAKPFSIWLCRADPARTGVPLGLLVPALRRVIGLVNGDPPVVQRTKLTTRVARRLPVSERERVSVFLGEMLGVPGEDDVMLRAARHDPQLMSDQLLRAWLDFLRAEAEALPILLLIEDMHWGDNASLQFLDAALGALADKPLFVLGMARPELWERAPNLWHGSDLASIELPPLSPEASIQFAHQTLGPEVDQERLSHLCGLAGGNPFYLEELLRGMASGRAEFPETVLAMIQGGFQELPEEARRALRAASVFGHEFWLGGVAALLGQEDRAPLRALLHRLVDEQILVARQDSRFHGEEEFAFWQSLLREAAYAALTEANRTVGHRLAAEWLEQRGESAPGVLAGHHERGGQRDRAIKYYAEAAYQALSANDLAGALAHVARGVECGAEGEALGRLRLIEAEVHNWRAEFAQAEPRSLEALRLLPRGRADWFRAISETVIAAGRLGHHEQLVAIAKTLLAVRWDATRSAAPLIAASRAVPRLMFAAQRPLATQLLEQIAKLDLSIVEDPLAEPWFKMALASASMISGDRSQFIYYIQDTIRGFERLGDQRTACLQRMDLGFGLFQIADYAGVVTTLSQVIKEAERLNLRRIPGAAMRALCPALARIGRMEEAKDVARHAISLLTTQGDLQQASSVRIHLAQLHMLSKQWDLAREESLAALSNLLTVAPVRPHALATLARIELHDRKVADALRYATEAMRLFKPMSGVDAGETLVRLVYAEALLASGQQDAARAAAQDALRYLMQRAHAISVPEHRDAFLHKILENAQTLAFARSLGLEV